MVIAEDIFDFEKMYTTTVLEVINTIAVILTILISGGSMFIGIITKDPILIFMFIPSFLVYGIIRLWLEFQIVIFKIYERLK